MQCEKQVTKKKKKKEGRNRIGVERPEVIKGPELEASWNEDASLKLFFFFMVGGCTRSPLDPPNPLNTYELWQSALASSALDVQHKLVERAEDAARANGLQE